MSILSSHMLLLAEHDLQNTYVVTDSSALRGGTLERSSQKGKVILLAGVGTPYRPAQGEFAPVHLALHHEFITLFSLGGCNKKGPPLEAGLRTLSRHRTF